MKAPRRTGAAVLKGGTSENSTNPAIGNGLLRARIDAEARATSLPLADLAVLDKRVDCYRQDTPAGRCDGAWLAAHMGWLKMPAFICERTERRREQGAAAPAVAAGDNGRGST
jgi:hypothetical protein